MTKEPVQLQEGEKILWTGRSQKGHFFSHGDFMFIPYSLFVGGFLLYCEFLLLTNSAPLMFQALGACIGLIGLYWIVGRLFYRVYKLSKSRYIITSIRVIESYDSPWLRQKEMSLTAFDKMVKYVEDKGTGTLLFGAHHPAILYRVNTGTEFLHPKLKQVVGFYHIEGAQGVFDMIKALQKGKGPVVE